MHNGVEKSIFQQKLRALKARRQRLPDDLLDHARAGEIPAGYSIHRP